MEGINKITARIIEDAEREIALMQQENEDKINTITAEAESAAEQESLELLARGRRAAEERRERLSSSAAVECRKLELAAKQEVLGQAFQLALDDLCALPEEQYIALLTALLKKASSTGREEVIFSPKDREKLGQKAVDAANAAIPAQLTLSQQTRPMEGGFILSDGDVELNCTFETLVRLQREKLEKAVIQVLFPE